jgi:hypothetical protein
MTDTIDAVERALTSEQKETFDARVAREAARIKHDIRNGQFDSDHVAVGLELEAYIVDSNTQLAPAPETVFELNGCSPELGVHNVEFHTTPDAIGAESDNGGSGFRRQASELHHIRDSIRSHIDDVDRTLVYDSLWTIPPETGTDAYLRAGTTEHGIFFAENVRPIPRYIALNEMIRERSGGTVELGLPGLDTAPSMLVESLATSIQPHLQIPDPRDAAAYLNAATRTMGPLLSLTANSPFLPADCYAGVSAEVAADRLARTPHELRIPIFERAVDTGAEKCRVPADADDIFDVIDRIVTDPTLVASSTLETPIPASDADPCDLSVFPTKRGTYWRWVRPVFCGQTPRGGAEQPLCRQITLVTQTMHQCVLSIAHFRLNQQSVIRLEYKHSLLVYCMGLLLPITHLRRSHGMMLRNHFMLLLRMVRRRHSPGLMIVEHIK